jgi:uncharacterized membrane protein YdjX (TVP38/TMEM64 family)
MNRIRPLNDDLRQHVRRAAALVLMLGVLLLVGLSSTVYGHVRLLVDRAAAIVAQYPFWGAALFVALAAASAMLAFFSAAVVVPVAVAAWGKVATVALLWTGWWIGAVASYLIGRYVGRAAIRWLIAEERLRRFERYTDRTLSFPRLLLLQIAIPSEIPGYALGLLKYSPARYLAAVAIVELPFAVGAVYLGDRFLARDYVVVAGVALAGLGITFIAAWLVHRQQASAEPALPTPPRGRPRPTMCAEPPARGA